MIPSILTFLLLALSLLRSVDTPVAVENDRTELLAPFMEALQDDGEFQRPPDVIPTFPAPYTDPNAKDDTSKPFREIG